MSSSVDWLKSEIQVTKKVKKYLDHCDGFVEKIHMERNISSEYKFR
jgi:hypothetical protein